MKEFYGIQSSMIQFDTKTVERHYEKIEKNRQ